MHIRNQHCLTTAAAGEMASCSHHDIELYELAELTADEEDVSSRGAKSWCTPPSDNRRYKNVGGTSPKDFLSLFCSFSATASDCPFRTIADDNQ